MFFVFPVVFFRATMGNLSHIELLETANFAVMKNGSAAVGYMAMETLSSVKEAISGLVWLVKVQSSIANIFRII